MFPLRKDVRVQGVDGKKMKLKSLTPGTSVLIYYNEKGGERTVKDIIVLEAGKNSKETKNSPAS